jgi:hypothetical protein
MDRRKVDVDGKTFWCEAERNHQDWLALTAVYLEEVGGANLLNRLTGNMIEEIEESEDFQEVFNDDLEEEEEEESDD